MTAAAADAVLPFHDPSRKRRLVKVVAWLAGIALASSCSTCSASTSAAGSPDLWDQIKAVPVGYIVAALVFQTGQTILAGLSYYGILSAAYPGRGHAPADRHRLRGRASR